MTETSEPEPDIPTQLKDIGKKYMRFISLSLDEVIKDLQPRAKRPPRPKKQLAEPKPKPKPKTKNLGFSRWLRGPKEEDPEQ